MSQEENNFNSELEPESESSDKSNIGASESVADGAQQSQNGLESEQVDTDPSEASNALESHREASSDSENVVEDSTIDASATEASAATDPRDAENADEESEGKVAPVGFNSENADTEPAKAERTSANRSTFFRSLTVTFIIIVVLAALGITWGVWSNHKALDKDNSSALVTHSLSNTALQLGNTDTLQNWIPVKASTDGNLISSTKDGKCRVLAKTADGASTAKLKSSGLKVYPKGNKSVMVLQETVAQKSNIVSYSFVGDYYPTDASASKRHLQVDYSCNSKADYHEKEMKQLLAGFVVS